MCDCNCGCSYCDYEEDYEPFIGPREKPSEFVVSLEKYYSKWALKTLNKKFAFRDIYL